MEKVDGVEHKVEVDGVEQTQEDFSPVFSIVTGRGQAGREFSDRCELI